MALSLSLALLAQFADAVYDFPHAGVFCRDGTTVVIVVINVVL